jgi:hypothetical protein
LKHVISAGMNRLWLCLYLNYENLKYPSEFTLGYFVMLILS